MRKQKPEQNLSAWRTPVYTPPPKTRKNTVARLLFCTCLCAAVLIVGVLFSRMQEYKSAQDEYAQYQAMDFATFAPETEPVHTDAAAQGQIETPMFALSTHVAPEATIAPKPFYSDMIADLQKQNSDAVGFLVVPGTDIRYPFLQRKDNEYYVNHTFQKKKNDSGAIFVDCWNSADFTDFNTVIYGHNMKDGSMFHGLRGYESQSFLRDHSAVEVTLKHSKLRYKVVAAYVSEGEEQADFRGQRCQTEPEKRAFLLALQKRSVIFSIETLEPEDRLLTLVTCTSGTHPWYWVVHAVLVEEQTTEM